MKKKGFTLIELLAVLVVLALLALITIPLVIGIIKNARVKSYERSIVNYGRTVETAVGVYLLDYDITLPSNISLKNLNIHTSGEEVIYDDTVSIKDDGKISLTNCYVSGTDEKYNYENRRLEKVNTNTTSTYKEYSVGDTFTLNGDSYHIIENSGASQDYVVAFKDTPLTTSELNTHGAGHLNMYNTDSESDYYQQAYDTNGIGGMSSFTSKTCNYIDDSGCTTSYATSEIKYAVDAWTAAEFTNSELKTVDGYSARLINYDEIPIERKEICTGSCYEVDIISYDWIYNSDYWYWTMTPWQDGDNPSFSNVWGVNNVGELEIYGVYDISGAVRPVINVYKDKLPE